jgi:hypothetical protein
MRLMCWPLGAALIAAAACGGAPTRPSTPSAVPAAILLEPAASPSPCVIGFDELRVHGAAFTTLTSCKLEVSVTAASWVASTSYGNPAPFVQFFSPAGTTTTGEITVSGVSTAFSFTSVDIYSSTTKIPYDISGFSGGALVFAIEAVQPNTFGGFATVGGPGPRGPLDKLRIRLTNPAAPCCTNPVGLDNIRVVR